MAKIIIDGERVLKMLSEDVESDSVPRTDFRDSDIPPILDICFEEIVKEHLHRIGTSQQKGGAKTNPPAARKAISKLKSWYTEFIPANNKSKDACLKRYKYMQHIGSGRYGDVYSGIDPHDNRKGFKYAIKTVFVHPFSHPMLYENLRNEIEIGKEMGESGIGPKFAAVHWCEQDGGILVMIVTELMTRGDLLSFSQTHAITDTHVKDIRKKIRALHRKGIVHNDLHPRNILVSDKPEGGFGFYIGDYGFAKRTKSREDMERDWRRLADLKSLATRDRLRGLLYNMVEDGRIKTDIIFDQSSGSHRTPWVSVEESSAPAGNTSHVHPSGK